MKRALSYGELVACAEEFGKQKSALGIAFESYEREEEAQLAFMEEYANGNDDPQLSEIITMYNF